MSNRDQGREGGGRNRSSGRPTSEFMPSPELLEGYDYVVEGAAARILSMFESEQKHRHEWESRALKTHASSTVLGQILGFLIAITVFISAAVISTHGNSTAAALIWVFGLAIVVMAGVVWIYAKSMGQRPLFARPAMRTHFRPEKDLDTEGKGVYVDRRDR